ncbi:SDR family oxidoreductase [Methylobacterium sp. NEAU K]|uniref:SDR family oxidoreductase n=1 Tax=Methylobacterium sp. NEAU K TaxID=3064946 RepID=UPI002734A6D4|nr:SDR family oxidoreductase [Methylobacterium sp. NEAU K]MDP4005645.1 SDR family oxidoreductase [Methylobacterium sp. NEAU K]
MRVNTATCGLSRTPLCSRMPEADRLAIFASTAERLPTRRIMQAKDTSNVALFLATTLFATGCTVRVDGDDVIG